MRHALFASLLALAGASCSTSNSTSENPATTPHEIGAGVGSLGVRLVDAPADVASVWVTIRELRFRRCDVDGWFSWDLGNREFDLLTLTDGNYADLLDGELLPSGEYCEGRLVLSGTSWLQLADGTWQELDVPSSEQSGYKIKGEFEIWPAHDTLITIDFDLDRSLVRRGNGKYLLKPTVHILEASTTPISAQAEEEPAHAGQFRVAPENLEVDLGDGARLVFPPSAGDLELPAFEFRLAYLGGRQLVTAVLEIEPSFDFDGDGPELHLPLTRPTDPAIPVFVHADGERLPTAIRGGYASAQLPHFSTFISMPVGTQTTTVDDPSVICSGEPDYWHEMPGAGMGGADARHTRNHTPAQGVENLCTYDFQDLRSGKWSVYVDIPPEHATTTSACYQVTWTGGEATVQVDQQAAAGRSVELGTWYVTGPLRVTLTDVTAEDFNSQDIGFSTVQVVPQDVEAEVGPAGPPCDPGLRDDFVPSSEGVVEFWEDVDTKCWTSVSGLGVMDVLYFDRTAADALRALAGEEEFTVIAALFLFMYVDGYLSVALENGFDIEDTLTELAADPAAVVSAIADTYGNDRRVSRRRVGRAIGLLDGLDFALMLWRASNLFDALVETDGDAYLLLGQHPTYELEPGFNFNGIIAVADSLDDDVVCMEDGWETFKTLLVDTVSFSSLNPVVFDPTGCSLGKALCHYESEFRDGRWEPTKSCERVPNNWESNALNSLVLGEDRWLPTEAVPENTCAGIEEPPAPEPELPPVMEPAPAPTPGRVLSLEELKRRLFCPPIDSVPFSAWDRCAVEVADIPLSHGYLEQSGFDPTPDGHHAGVDFPGSRRVRSPVNGRVAAAGGPCGKVVIADARDEETRHVFLHLDAIPLDVGQEISVGMSIGVSSDVAGGGCIATGDNLHYEIRHPYLSTFAVGTTTCGGACSTESLTLDPLAFEYP